MNMILLFSFLLSSVDHYGLSWFLSITIIVKRGQPVARLSFNHFDCAGIAIVARMVFVGKWLVAVWSRARETIVTHTPRCRLQTKGSMHFAAVSQAISIWWLCITMTRPATTDDCCPSTDAVAMWAAGGWVQGGGSEMQLELGVCMSLRPRLTYASRWDCRLALLYRVLGIGSVPKIGSMINMRICHGVGHELNGSAENWRRFRREFA